MRILITGGAGFLGSHLAESLVGQGHQVISMDNLSTGKVENVAHLMGNELFSFVKYNVCDYIHVEGHLDAVMHFASPASPQDYLDMPIATMKVGGLGTHKALGLAKAKGARFLIASTSEVYGDPLVNPQPESYWGNVNPISPRGVYDEAKRFAEAMTMAYQRYHGLDTRIVRIFNTFGPRMRPNDGRVVSNFIVQAIQGKPLTVYGDGNQTRSFCYVDDLVRGIIALLLVDSDKTVEQRTDRKSFFIKQESNQVSSVHDPVNIGNPRELTVLQIAKEILKLTRSSSQITHHPLPADDPKVRRPDITRAKMFLKWEPQVELEDALVKTIQYFKKALAGC
ncbi:putative dTDP-glucose 4,6-dehydratase [Candidatus Nitrospira nitrosa]|jgi:dTDP-glucose 4,6-dehydratase|uniref:UDP-glucuronate decarboxylase n=1 Tax=Candidatus Nitrospira nitrosa TaxID=1742972 RepID=A0A0S4LNQ0_9BACT|nr:UDP-glucuronic acid decarboxylase family protein [Candidatus Nitrospira nitrosa]CUS38362.1 putative dTDP-glucose 4,6-dehydratase [Candidatus Nitrospira nitrosa]HRI39357.1 SDR family oxidoreductase [Nitrospira sp.]